MRQGAEEARWQARPVQANRRRLACRGREAPARAAAHGAPGVRPPRGGMRIRRRLHHRAEVCEGKKSRDQVRQGRVLELGMGARGGPGRLRRLRLQGARRRPGSPLPRRHLPLLQRLAGAVLLGRGLRVRARGPEGRVRVLRRGADEAGVRQRCRRRQARGREDPDGGRLHALCRPPRLPALLLQPRLRPREGVRGKRRGRRPPQPVRADAARRQPPCLQQTPPREVHGAGRQGPLPERRAGTAAVRGGPGGHGGSAGEAVPRREDRLGEDGQARRRLPRGEAPLPPLGPERGEERADVELGAFRVAFYGREGSKIASFDRAYDDAPDLGIYDAVFAREA